MNIYTMPNGDIELADWPYRRSQDWCNIVWIITEQCNLGCPYCVGAQSKGLARSIFDQHSRGDVLSALERLRDASGKNLWLTITGGEPTLVADLTRFCGDAAKKGFKIDLQSNLTLPRARGFVDEMDPEAVVLLEAAYHDWAMLVSPGRRDRYFENLFGAVQHDLNAVLKLVVTPDMVSTIRARTERLFDAIPAGMPILLWSYIEGIPQSISDPQGAYPLSYTVDQKAILDVEMVVRGGCQQAFRSGAGFFKGMGCDAGRGLVYMNVHGDLYPCFTQSVVKPESRLGNLLDPKPPLLRSHPTQCPASFCQCAMHGLWYGVDPWNYVPGVSKDNAYYCRYGPSCKI